MTDRYITTRHRIALLNGMLISAAVPLDGDTEAAIAAVAAKAGIEFDRADVRTPEVYLSDIDYDDLLVAHRSGEGGHIVTSDGEHEYRYAYDVADADGEAGKFLDREGRELQRLIGNLAGSVELSGNINRDWASPLRDGTLDTMDVLEMRRALELRSEIEQFVEAYLDGCGAQPDIDDVLKDLEEKNLLPEHEYWIVDPFVVAAAALAVDVIDDADVSEEAAEKALKARDEDLIIVGRDPDRDHKIHVGREIEDGRMFVSVAHFQDYRSVVAWAEDDREHDGTWSDAA
ncbi:hypothetical protein [Aureimonas sp. AU40]|uniref:hypothetical protein n=1 Tax=Aureimonas sp. AU40 TaxID=1637747 RepID=UPI00078260AD|nr:hypothetical protein [Aureimonas sp. AU40]